MAFDIKKAVSKAAKTVDMNQAQKGGGGEYVPPAKGVPGLRFIAYVELGPQKDSWQGKERIREKVQLVFELHGKRWPLSENGQPPRMTVKLAKSLHEKSGFYKLFKALNYTGKHKHIAEMLGQDFVGTVYHGTFGEGDKATTFATFKDPVTGIINIRPPFVEDEDGEPQRRNVPEAINDLRLFLWDAPDADQWASIFIEGSYDDGKSKNVWQETIKGSPEFDGSPVEALLVGDIDTGDEDDPEVAKAAAKTRKAKAAPKADHGDDEDGTNAVSDEPAKTTRPKTEQAKRAPVKEKAKVEEPAFDPDGDDDDPLGDLDGDDE